MVTMTTIINPKDVQLLPLLLESLFKKFSRGRGGVHVSDLITCTLRAYYGKKNAVKPTANQLNWFSSGNGIHDAIQALVMTDPERFKREKPVRFKDVEGHIDIYDSVNKIPIEIKSIRAMNSDGPKEGHLAQLKSYMAILDVEYGLLLYQLLLHRDNKPFVEYSIYCDKEERSQILGILSERSDLLQKALIDDDIWDLPHVGWDQKSDWMCQTCAFFDECFTHRYHQLPKVIDPSLPGRPITNIRRDELKMVTTVPGGDDDE